MNISEQAKKWKVSEIVARDILADAAPPAAAAETPNTAERAKEITDNWPQWKKEFKPAQDYSLPTTDAPTEQFTDCPHASPFRYCDTCAVTPCPIGLGENK